MLIGTDLDGVLTEGVMPSGRLIVVTGRSYELESQTVTDLARLKVDCKYLYMNPCKVSGMGWLASAKHKANIINTMRIDVFYEDEARQANYLLNHTDAQIILVTSLKIRQ